MIWISNIYCTKDVICTNEYIITLKKKIDWRKHKSGI